jgi:hypothetical protein
MLNPQNTSCEYGKVFCDWLDITFSTLYSEQSEFIDFFLDTGFVLRPNNFSRSVVLECGLTRSIGDVSRGVIKIDTIESNSIIRVSISGVALEYLRSTNWFNEMVGFFFERPYHITRIDSALDVNAIGFEKIKDLRTKHPENCSLSSRALRTKSILSKGFHGRSTGTFYVGHSSKASATARCYDKRHQIWEQTGHDIGFNVFRYEIVSKFKRDRAGASLRDVSDPTELFYHYASPSLVRKPKDIPAWEPRMEGGFDIVRAELSLPLDRMKALIENNYLFERITKLSAEDGGGGIDYAVKLLRKELEKYSALDVPVVSDTDAHSTVA